MDGSGPRFVHLEAARFLRAEGLETPTSRKGSENWGTPVSSAEGRLFAAKNVAHDDKVILGGDGGSSPSVTSVRGVLPL